MNPNVRARPPQPLCGPLRCSAQNVPPPIARKLSPNLSDTSLGAPRQGPHQDWEPVVVRKRGGGGGGGGGGGAASTEKKCEAPTDPTPSPLQALPPAHARARRRSRRGRQHAEVGAGAAGAEAGRGDRRGWLQKCGPDRPLLLPSGAPCAPPSRRALSWLARARRSGEGEHGSEDSDHEGSPGEGADAEGAGHGAPRAPGRPIPPCADRRPAFADRKCPRSRRW